MLKSLRIKIHRWLFNTPHFLETLDNISTRQKTILADMETLNRNIHILSDTMKTRNRMMDKNYQYLTTQLKQLQIKYKKQPQSIPSGSTSKR